MRMTPTVVETRGTPNGRNITPRLVIPKPVPGGFTTPKHNFSRKGEIQGTSKTEGFGQRPNGVAKQDPSSGRAAGIKVAVGAASPSALYQRLNLAQADQLRSLIATANSNCFFLNTLVGIDVFHWLLLSSPLGIESPPCYHSTKSTKTCKISL